MNLVKLLIKNIGTIKKVLPLLVILGEIAGFAAAKFEGFKWSDNDTQG